MHVTNLYEFVKAGLLFIHSNACNTWHNKKIMHSKFIRPALGSHNSHK